ncbi:unnamed protein product [Blepharisma stoltei]|uniref:VHS domain-containing protein n=1 Tax=Blepharisma stoltei TaxID=1481888 RepID=A0AAU9J139_9CILI|nr:unnamed protein product [Blepharisma stoltei]
MDLVRRGIASQEEYEAAISLLPESIKKASLNVCKDVVSFIKKIIKDKHSPPKSKLLAIKLFHTCMMAGNVHFLQYSQKKIMSRLTILAAHKKNNPDESRGDDLWGRDSLSSEENRRASREFLMNLLVFIQTWASQYGKTPDGKMSAYYKAYQSLRQDGVSFPQRNLAASPMPRQAENNAPRQSMQNYPSQARQPQRSNRRLSTQKKTEIQSTLEILSEMLKTDGCDQDFLNEITGSLKVQKGEIEREIAIASNSNDSEYLQELIIINDRIQAALEKHSESQIIEVPDDMEEGISVSVPAISKPAKDSMRDSEKFQFSFDMPAQQEFSAMNFATHNPNSSDLLSPEKFKSETSIKLPKSQSKEEGDKREILLPAKKEEKKEIIPPAKKEIKEVASPIKREKEIREVISPVKKEAEINAGLVIENQSNGKIKDLEKRNEILVEENKKLREIKSEFKKAKQENEFLREENEGMKETIKMMQESIEEIKDLRKSNKSLKAVVNEFEDWKKEREQLTSENNRLKEEISGLEKAVESTGDFNEEKKQLNQANKRLKDIIKGLEETGKLKESQFNGKIKELEKIKESLNEELSNLNEIPVLLNNSKQENEKLKVENNQMKETIKIMQESIEEIKELRKTNKSLSLKISELEEIIKAKEKVESENEALREEIERLEKMVENKEDINEERKELKQVNKHLKETIRELEGSIKLKEELAKEYDNLANENEELKKNLQSQKELEKRINIISNENEKLQTRLLSSSDKEKQLADLMSQNRALSNDFEKLKKEYSEIQNQNSSLMQNLSELQQSSKELKEVSKENSKLKSIINDYEGKLKDREELFAENQNLNEMLRLSDVKEKEFEKVSSENQKLKMILQVNEGKISELVLIKNENEKLKTAVKKYEDQLTKINKKYDDIKNQNQEFQEKTLELSDLQKKIEEFKQKKKEFKENHEKVVETLQTEIMDLRKINEINDDKLQILDSLVFENSNLKSQLEVKDEQAKKVPQLELKIQKISSELEEKSKSWQIERNESQSSLEIAIKTIQDKDALIQNLKEVNLSLQKEVQALKASQSYEKVISQRGLESPSLPEIGKLQRQLDSPPILEKEKIPKKLESPLLAETGNVQKPMKSPSLAEIGKIQKPLESPSISEIKSSHKQTESMHQEKLPISPDVSVKLNSSNPFGSSSSSEELEIYNLELPNEQAEPDSIDNNELCRLCNCVDRGVLYDDDRIQIGIKLIKQDDMIAGIMYFGNKYTEAIRDLRTEVISYPNEGLHLTIDNEQSDPIQPKAQCFKQIKAKISGFTHKSPKLIITLRQEQIRNICLKLPITILRFFEGVSNFGNKVWIEWENLKFNQCECITQLYQIRSISELAHHLSFCEAIKIFSNQEIPNLQTGQLLGSTHRDENEAYILVSISPETLSVDLKIRSSSKPLRETLLSIISAQISGKAG